MLGKNAMIFYETENIKFINYKKPRKDTKANKIIIWSK